MVCPSNTHMSPTMDPKRLPEPRAFLDDLGAFALDGTERQVRPAEAAPDKIRQWSDYSKPETIRNICIHKVPGWSAYRQTDIIVDQLLEGLSNQLFKVHVETARAKEQPASIACVLFRIYGKEVAELIDQAVEFKIFKTLSSYQIAPQMYGHDPNWRIEEWHTAVALKCRHMRNPSILTQVAAGLGRFHKLASRHDFPRDLQGLEPACLKRCEKWINNCDNAAAKSGHDRESLRALANLNLPEVYAEQNWLRSYAIADDPHIKGSGLDIVFSHEDLQENNILQTQYGLRFIDFEYASMDYQAYDIANYFCECMIDYCVIEYPFYSVSLSDYPTEWEQRLFCSIYLSEYLESRIMLDDLAVTRLLSRVQRFTLVSHYLWTIWSVVRAPGGVTFNDFDFLHYGQARWDLYKRTKCELLAADEDHSMSRLSTPTVSRGDLQQSLRTPSECGDEFGSQQAPVGIAACFLGGALTGGGMLVGVLAIVWSIKLLQR